VTDAGGTEEARTMLSSKRCPFTGIVNFFSENDPHIAIGSIARCGRPAAPAPTFLWRCYTSDGLSSGLAPDLATAERRLTNFLAMLEGEEVRAAVASRSTAAA
jgi:hypothetical protein